MGDINQLLFIEKHRDQFVGPFLEVGSKDYGSTQDTRSLFAAGTERYVGVDVEDGPGVDVVLDLTADFHQIDRRLEGIRFGTIFLLSVLEHCEQPFRMADNLTRLLRPGGRICVSAPFAFRYHAYPADYWRFTHQGIRKLFDRLEFCEAHGVAATSRKGDFRPLDRNLGQIHFGSKPHWREGRILRGITAKSLSLLARLGILRWLAGYRYVLAPTDVMMIGTAPDEE